MSIFEYKFIKKIDFFNRIKDLLPGETWLTDLQTPHGINRNADFEFVVNNNFDVCCKISRKCHVEENEGNKRMAANSFVEHINHSNHGNLSHE